ncbi:ubiquinone biosynthesis protein COQ4 mitochondrial [Biomphalaria glabrata]
MKGTLNSTHLNSFRTLRISSVISNDINNEVPSNTSHQQYDMFYPGHISTSLFQKSLLAAGSGIACLLNPARDDMLCALGETTGPLALKYIHSKMMSDSVGRQILE